MSQTPRGRYATETLECGCYLEGYVVPEPFSGDFTRTPCDRHNDLGACLYCLSGRAHPTCERCGLSDGRHASWCTS